MNELLQETNKHELKNKNKNKKQVVTIYGLVERNESERFLAIEHIPLGNLKKLLPQRFVFS